MKCVLVVVLMQLHPLGAVDATGEPLWDVKATSNIEFDDGAACERGKYIFDLMGKARQFKVLLACTPKGGVSMQCAPTEDNPLPPFSPTPTPPMQAPPPALKPEFFS